jgi:CMP-N,N'-diacetyllegionaminic acid synthase
VNTFALIPARGGSKGVPRKNITMVAGKPLIVWSIECALRSSLLDAVVVSTDDEEIAEISLKAGALVPFLRPSHLAQASTPGVDPVLHALEQLPQFDAVVLMQPTSPLRATVDVDGCLNFAIERHALSVVSVCEAETHPYWTYRLAENKTLEKFVNADFVPRRQDLPQVFTINGALYFAQAEWLRRIGSFIGDETLAYVMPRERSLDIDTKFDLQIAEFLMKEMV